LAEGGDTLFDGPRFGEELSLLPPGSSSFPIGVKMEQ
jgi:hypothetical protein